MRQLCMQNTRSILLTSGTLSPIDSFKTQLAMWDYRKHFEYENLFLLIIQSIWYRHTKRPCHRRKSIICCCSTSISWK